MKSLKNLKWADLLGPLGRIACLGVIVGSLSSLVQADSGPWTAYNGFSGTEGTNQWYYLQRPRGGGSTSNMTWNSSGGYNPPGTGYWAAITNGWLYWADTHPSSTYDTLRTWKAPFAGNVSITGRAFKIDTAGGTTGAVNVSVEQNGVSIWSKSLQPTDGVGYVTDADLGQVAVAANDTLAFVASYSGTFGYDQTGWNPTVSYSYTGSGGFSGTQGGNQWHYQERPKGGGTVTNLVWHSSGGYSPPGTGYWGTSDGTGWMYWTDSHPGQNSDTMRTWVAPAAGTISITGRVYKINTGGGGGVNATIEHNGTQIWSKAVAFNDSTGYSMDGDPSLTSVTVAANDTVSFILDAPGTFGYEQTGWDPMIVYSNSTAAAPAWNLHTADTQIILSIIGDRPAITRMEDTGGGWNWAPSPVVLPLLNKIWIGSTQYNPHWVYSSASVDTTNGTKVTLTFTSSSPWPALTMTQAWWAAPTGGGPIEVTTSVTNNTGSTVTYYDADILSTDLTLIADQAVTLWRFNRASVSSGSDPGFTTGVFTQTLAANASVASTISNDYNPGAYVLPFEMLDVGGGHGAYVGYENSFGNFTTSTGSNAYAVRTVFQLWSSNSFNQATGTTLALPSVFYGTYVGDTDTGSNKMKAWFWANKMTPTLRTTTGEPLVEADCTLDSEYNFTHQTPGIATVAGWGVELMKQDDTWTNDVSSDPPFGWDWEPNSSYWPSGMDLGNITHGYSMKLSLYMANRYTHVDLSTAAGVSSEETAVETRFNGTATNFVGPGFDYWRTDMEFEPTADFLSHQGFLSVMDYMIANHSGFRWENCSAGGSKKSFDFAQRESFGVLEDSGLSTDSITHLMQSYYPGSYVFNPAQLGIQNADFLSGTNADGLYNFRTGFLGAWLWGIQAATWTGNTHYPDYVTLYKNKQRAILRGADVYHILPMPTGSNWFGIEFFNTALNKGSVILLKPNSGVGNSPTIVFKGLVPTTNYTLTFQDRTSLNGTYSGSTLMTTGISPISGNTGDVDSEIIWINY